MLRTLFFGLIGVVVTVYCAIISIGVGFFRRYSKFVYFNIIKHWAKALVWASGTPVTVEGEEHIDPGRSYIVVSNHQSHMDIPALLKALPLHLTIIAKKELFRIPLFGQGMRAFGILEIDRRNRAQAISTLKKAAEVVKQRNISILAFPEGTRSEDGSLQPFKKGPFVLAINSGMPVLPVSIQGTFPILPKGKMLIRSGHRVGITIHPPVETEGYLFGNRNQLIETVHDFVAAGLYTHET